jgi:hypothetical protein
VLLYASVIFDKTAGINGMKQILYCYIALILFYALVIVTRLGNHCMNYFKVLYRVRP